MATEALAPDVLIVQTNLSGTVADIDEDPDSPDANWLVATDGTQNTICRVSFPTPTGNPTVGTGLQEFKLWLRSTSMSGGKDTSFDVVLYENGGSVSTLISGQALAAGGTTVLVTPTWNASLLSNIDGSGVECYVIGYSGNPTKGDTVEVGAIEWIADYVEPVAEFPFYTPKRVEHSSLRR